MAVTDSFVGHLHAWVRSSRLRRACTWFNVASMTSIRCFVLFSFCTYDDSDGVCVTSTKFSSSFQQSAPSPTEQRDHRARRSVPAERRRISFCNSSCAVNTARTLHWSITMPFMPTQERHALCISLSHDRQEQALQSLRKLLSSFSFADGWRSLRGWLRAVHRQVVADWPEEPPNEPVCRAKAERRERSANALEMPARGGQNGSPKGKESSSDFSRLLIGGKVVKILGTRLPALCWPRTVLSLPLLHKHSPFVSALSH